MACETVNWPSDFQELKRLDTILKCGICYEYMTTCMMTSCCHNYCSLCIRKFMQYKTQCPTCFEETFEMHLRNNRLIDDVITIYSQIRDKLLRSLRIAALAPPPTSDQSPKAFPPSSHSTPKGPTPTTPSAPKAFSASKTLFPIKQDKGKRAQSSAKALPDAAPTQSEGLLVNGVKIPGMFHHSPKTTALPKVKKEEELTDCPVCNVSVPKKNINLHLDACLARSNNVNQPLPKPKTKKREPLVKRLYHLMPDKTLRKTLKDYGLNSTGDRKTLVNRIQRYTVLYNAEADKDNPRPIFDLVSQVEREEREEKKQPSLLKSMHARMTIDRKTDPEVIEKVNKEYCDENKESFKKLIEAMRAREGKNIRPLKPAARIPSDDENDFWTNANRPSTSGTATQSQPTNHPHKESDSDDDIFIEGSPYKKSVSLSQGKPSLIDWNKTILDSQEHEVLEGEPEKKDAPQDLDDTLEGVNTLDETLPGPSENENTEEVDVLPSGRPFIHSSNESLFEPVTARSLSPLMSSQKQKKVGKSPFSSKRRGSKAQDQLVDEASDPVETSFREGSELLDHLASMFPGVDSCGSDTHSVSSKSEEGVCCEEPLRRRRSKRKPLARHDKDHVMDDVPQTRTRSRTKRVKPSSPA